MNMNWPRRMACIFLWQTQPVRILGRDGMVTGLECVRTELDAPEVVRTGARACPNLFPAANSRSTWTWSCARWDKNLYRMPPRSERPRTAPQRHIAINERQQTGNPKYFAGGDCTNGGKEVVDAVAEGMAAARGIDASLGAPRDASLRERVTRR